MTIVPPWVGTGLTIDALVSHPYMLLTAPGWDKLVFFIFLGLTSALATKCMLQRRTWYGGLWMAAGLHLMLSGMFYGHRLVSEEVRLVLQPRAQDVMAAIAGCAPGWLPQREYPNACGAQLQGAQGPYEFSPQAWSNWFGIAEKVATALQERECMFVSAGIGSVVACATNVSPTSLRTLVGYHTPPGLPNKLCQISQVVNEFGIHRAMYALEGGSFALAYQEDSLYCAGGTGTTVEVLPIKDAWVRDLVAYELMLQK